MSSKAVMIKSYQNGITIVMKEEVPFKEVLSQIGEKFSQSRSFFQDSKIALSLEGRTLDKKQELLVLEAIEQNSDVEVVCIVGKDEETEKLVNTSDKITIDGTSITLSESMTAEEFEEFVYAGEGYAMTLQKADGSALAAGDKLTTGCKLVLTKDGETVETYTITAPADGE